MAVLEAPGLDKVWEWIRDGSEVADLNLSIGNFIRNSFGLWSGNDELMWSCTKEARQEDLTRG